MLTTWSIKAIKRFLLLRFYLLHYVLCCRYLPPCCSLLQIWLAVQEEPSSRLFSMDYDCLWFRYNLHRKMWFDLITCHSALLVTKLYHLLFVNADTSVCISLFPCSQYSLHLLRLIKTKDCYIEFTLPEKWRIAVTLSSFLPQFLLLLR